MLSGDGRLVYAQKDDSYGAMGFYLRCWLWAGLSLVLWIDRTRQQSPPSFSIRSLILSPSIVWKVCIFVAVCQIQPNRSSRLVGKSEQQQTFSKWATNTTRPKRAGHWKAANCTCLRWTSWPMSFVKASPYISLVHKWMSSTVRIWANHLSTWLHLVFDTFPIGLSVDFVFLEMKWHTT